MKEDVLYGSLVSRENAIGSIGGLAIEGAAGSGGGAKK
jgi:hypothetical protein